MDLDTDEATKLALLQLLELEREHLASSRFTYRADFKSIISKVAVEWPGSTDED
jgi:hypothetical protein